MNEFTRIILLGIIVFATHCLEGITGFGCTVLALPFVALLLGLKTAVPVLVALAWTLTCYIIIRSWKHISWKEFFFILLYVGIGLPFGIAFFDLFSEHALKAVLSLFMIFVGIHGFTKTCRNKSELLNGSSSGAVRKTPLMKGILMLGGIVHGAFGTGGPFVVIYASRALPNKTLFRVTLCLLWFSLNTIMITKWAIQGGVWTEETLIGVCVSLPFLISGMLLGDYLHHKANEFYFKILVYAVLFLSGLVMGYSTLRCFF